MMQDDDDDDDDDDNDDPMILNNRAKNHTSERTIVPWTVIFSLLFIKKFILKGIITISVHFDSLQAALGEGIFMWRLTLQRMTIPRCVIWIC